MMHGPFHKKRSGASQCRARMPNCCQSTNVLVGTTSCSTLLSYSNQLTMGHRPSCLPIGRWPLYADRIEVGLRVVVVAQELDDA